MTEETSEKAMNLKLMLAISALCITGYGTIIGNIPLDWPLKIISIIAAIFVYLIFLVKYYQISDYEDFKTKEKYYDNLNLIFYTKKIKRKIIIHDRDGTATNYIKYTVQNVSNMPIPQITRNIFFDGDLESFSLKLNKKEIDWEKIEKKSLKSERFGENQAFRLYIKFPDNLNKGEKATIKLQYKSTKLYPNAFKVDPEYYEYTLIRFTYPHDNFELKIKLEKNEDLKDYVIYNKGIEIKIYLLDLKDPLEYFRFQKNHKELCPEGSETKELIWKFDNPKIGNYYKLLFHCQKE